LKELIIWLAVLVVGIVGVPIVGGLFTVAVHRWLPLREGEVRPSSSYLGCGVLGIAAGLFFGGLAAASLAVNPTAPFGVLLGLGFMFFGIPMVWWWSVWRLRLDGDQLHLRYGFGRSRTTAWSGLRVVQGRYWRNQVVLRFENARPIMVSAEAEGLGVLLDAAWKRSVPFKDFDRFLKAGKIVFPTET
jgi:hypothetical protein